MESIIWRTLSEVPHIANKDFRFFMSGLVDVLDDRFGFRLFLLAVHANGISLLSRKPEPVRDRCRGKLR